MTTAPTGAAAQVPAAPKERKPKADNRHRGLRLDKIGINIGAGEAGERLQKAERVLAMITGHKPVRTISQTTNKELARRAGMPIGCKVTLRKKAADGFLRAALEHTRDFQLPLYSIDDQGNISFGIPEYTELPGQKYNPEIGVFGMDVCVVLARTGTRIRDRARMRRAMPQRQRVTVDEAQAFLEKEFKVRFS